MPRIREIKVAPFNEVQMIDDDASIVITGDVEADLLTAVGADYADGMMEDPGCSDIYQAWRHGLGAVAAGMLSGATECAHVDAVVCAYKFNYPDWRARLARFYDPYADSEWSELHYATGTTCPGCEATNYGEDGPPDSAACCGNCGASLASGSPAGVSADELDDFVFGYITAGTWSDLQHTCEECSGDGVQYVVMVDGEAEPNPDDETEDWLMSLDDAEDVARDRRGIWPDAIITAERQDCSACDGSGGAQESGSDPYEYGPDDLDGDLLSEIRADCADFIRASLDDVRRWADLRGPIVDHPRAAGGAQLGARECGGWELAGTDFYLNAAGHGTGFWDRYSAPLIPRDFKRDPDTGEWTSTARVVPAMWAWATAHARGLYLLGERLSAASRPHTPPNLTLDPDGRIYS